MRTGQMTLHGTLSQHYAALFMNKPSKQFGRNMVIKLFRTIPGALDRCCVALTLEATHVIQNDPVRTLAA